MLVKMNCAASRWLGAQGGLARAQVGPGAAAWLLCLLEENVSLRKEGEARSVILDFWWSCSNSGCCLQRVSVFLTTKLLYQKYGELLG